MILFSRSKNHLEVLAAEFLPFEQQLYVIIADADENLQVLQFDPESKLPSFVPTHSFTSMLTCNCRSKVDKRLSPPPQIHLPHRPLPRLHAPPPIVSQNAINIRVPRHLFIPLTQ